MSYSPWYSIILPNNKKKYPIYFIIYLLIFLILSIIIYYYLSKKNKFEQTPYTIQQQFEDVMNKFENCIYNEVKQKDKSFWDSIDSSNDKRVVEINNKCKDQSGITKFKYKIFDNIFNLIGDGDWDKFMNPKNFPNEFSNIVGEDLITKKLLQLINKIIKGIRPCNKDDTKEECENNKTKNFEWYKLNLKKYIFPYLLPNTTERPTDRPTPYTTMRPTERPTQRPTQRPTPYTTMKPTPYTTMKPIQRPTPYTEPN